MNPPLALVLAPSKPSNGDTGIQHTLGTRIHQPARGNPTTIIISQDLTCLRDAQTKGTINYIEPSHLLLPSSPSKSIPSRSPSYHLPLRVLLFFFWIGGSFFLSEIPLVQSKFQERAKGSLYTPDHARACSVKVASRNLVR